MSHHVVVVNDCHAVSALGGPTNVRTKETRFGERNFILGANNVVAGLPRTLSDRELDWIELAVYVFAIDLACKRGEGDIHWNREIEAYVPVRDPVFWRGQAVAIQEIFGDFTGDRLSLTFVQDENPSPPPRQRQNPFPDYDCVSLLSGGVDSFVGTAKLVEDGRRPLALSHVAAGVIGSAQGRVEEALRTRHESLERLGLTAKKSGRTFPTTEPSQRSRTFMFLAAATLVASMSDPSDVFICENGTMAIHLPMTTARIGSLSTRTASPVILRRYQALATNVLGKPIHIRNTLLGHTKPEVVELGIELGLSDALADTVSCWKIGRTSRHCGYCAPCLIRRISFATHSLSDASYEEDAFGDLTILNRDAACDNLVHLVRLVDDLCGSTSLELQLKYPELLGGGDQLPLRDAIDLHRRWGVQAQSLLSTQPVVQTLL